MNVRDGWKWYSDLAGPSGILAICGYRLIGRPKAIAMHPSGIRHPFYVRIKTTDEFVYRSVLLRGEYSVDLSFSPKMILDAGANIGATSIYFANKYPEARIVAVEPENSNFSLLVKNVRRYPAIIPIQAALWNKDGRVGMEAPDPETGSYGEWGFITNDGCAGVTVRALTMRTLMHELGVESFDLAKIDIEGAEQEVFEDAQWLVGTRCLMIETHDRFRPGCSGRVQAAMGGFARTQHGEMMLYIKGGGDIISFPFAEVLTRSAERSW